LLGSIILSACLVWGFVASLVIVYPTNTNYGKFESFLAIPKYSAFSDTRNNDSDVGLQKSCNLKSRGYQYFYHLFLANYNLLFCLSVDC